ncbi:MULTISPECIES: hypothetical protein [Gammaproteobacteria]|uniref:hypothetical protein n=1 Tax=Gammaproteobacteria TaxID=1236 RepID=UPI000DCFE492|nr:MULTISPECIES: hypothetical protein [Gammaproteobacteria]RTE85761.1 hypothetical protein DQX04_09940 [Aliidiomarina sp. B3213]TCZ90236.1 hypothetical protein EYQ95_10515 [Lysobacter sp. N42]
MKKLIILLLTFVGAYSFNAPAQAQSAGGETLPSLIEKLQTCKGIEDSLARLVCFDNIVAALPASETLAETPVSEQTVEEGETSEAFLDITEMWQDSRQMWHLRLRNGEVWRQQERDTGFPFEVGRQYYLQKGMFNSHYLRTPGLNRRVRVVRDN